MIFSPIRLFDSELEVFLSAVCDAFLLYSGLYFISSVERITRSTPLCLQEWTHNFSPIDSLQTCPSKTTDWETLVNMCTIKLMMFHCHSSAAPHTHTHTLLMLVHTGSHVFQNKEGSRLDLPTHSYVFPPNDLGSATDRRTHQHKHTLFNFYSLVLPAQFPSLRGSMSKSRDVTATTWRKKRNS